MEITHYSINKEGYLCFDCLSHIEIKGIYETNSHTIAFYVQ